MVYINFYIYIYCLLLNQCWPIKLHVGKQPNKLIRKKLGRLNKMKCRIPYESLREWVGLE